MSILTKLVSFGQPLNRIKTEDYREGKIVAEGDFRIGSYETDEKHPSFFIETFCMDDRKMSAIDVRIDDIAR